MDWQLVIDRNRDALLRLLALWVASVQRFAVDGAVTTLPRYVRSNALRLLRPAEAAARRLIVIEASGLTVAPRPAPSPPKHKIPRGKGARVPAFRLFDPRKNFEPRRRYAKVRPRIHLLYDDPTLPLIARRQIAAELAAFAPKSPSSPGDPVSAERLCRRLQALQNALENLPRQARRLARWKAKREQTGKGYLSPLRPGWPPGHRSKPAHTAEEILSDCHALALRSLAEANAALLKPG